MCDSLRQIVEKPQGCKDIHLKGALWKKFEKAAVRSVHCKSQIALIGIQSMKIVSNSTLARLGWGVVDQSSYLNALMLS